MEQTDVPALAEYVGQVIPASKEIVFLVKSLVLIVMLIMSLEAGLIILLKEL